MNTHEHRTEGDPANAAGWQVALDAAPGDAGLAGRFAVWLEASAAHEREMQRVELAMELGRQLATDPDLMASAVRPAIRRSFAIGAGAAAALVVGLAATIILSLSFMHRGRPPEVGPELRATALVAATAPVDSAVVLPTGVVVDSGSVALLPFAAEGAARVLAAGLEADIAAALRGVPGVYVVDGSATAPYSAAIGLSAAEVGSQLGARALVDARVSLMDGRVRVVAQLKDARSGEVAWQNDVDEPVDRLAHVRDAIADGIALTLLDSSAQSSTAPGRGAPAFATNVVEPTLLK